MIVAGTSETHVVKYVIERFDHLKSQRKQRELNWLECVRANHSIFEEGWKEAAREGRSARFVSLSFDATETLASILSNVIFGKGDKYIGLTPGIAGGLKHDDEAAKEMRAYLYMQAENMSFRRHCKVLFKQLAIVGNAPYTMSWRKEMAVNYPKYQAAMLEWKVEHRFAWQEYQAVTNAWKQAAAQAAAAGEEPPKRPNIVAPEPPPVDMKVASQGPVLEVGDIFNFVVDPFSIDQKHSLKIKRSWMPLEILKNLAERDESGYAVYENLENVSEIDRRSSGSRDDFIQQRYNAFGLQVPDASQVELLEATGTMEIPNAHPDNPKQTYVSFIATVANGRELIRFEPTYLWSGDSPTQLATYRDVPGHVYGIGAIEMGLGLQSLVNARANQAVDVVNYILNPEFKAVDDGVIERTPRSAPNKIHWVGSMDNFEPIQKNMSGVQISMQDLGDLKREFQLLTKANTPVGGDPKESATKTGLDANIIGQDVTSIAGHIEDTVVNKMFDMMIQLDSQYISKEEMVRYLQDGDIAFKKISPETIRRGWLFRSQGTQFYADRMEKIQNLMMFLNTIAANPLLVAPVKIMELEKRIAEELGIEDGGSIFHSGDDADAILNRMIESGMIGNLPQVPQAASGGGGSEAQ